MQKLISASYSFSALVTAFFIAWIMLFKVDFLYPTFYDLLDIDQTITQYGAQNRYKNDFELTTKQQHIRLFAGINRAIHQNGEGLAQLSYSVIKNGKQSTSILLLRDAEVVHLQDVAHLLNVLTQLALGFIVLWLLSSVSFMYRKKPLPNFKSQLLSVVSIVLVASLAVLIIGAKKVFYWLHTVIFPADNQWFFYYQDSLMTTLMKAPDLFAPISVVLVVLALIVFVFMKLLMHKIANALNH